MNELTVLDKQGKPIEPLVARCGHAAHLVPDTLLVTAALINDHPIGKTVEARCEGIFDKLRWLTLRPLMRALLENNDVDGAKYYCACQPKEYPPNQRRVMCKVKNQPYEPDKFVEDAESSKPLDVQNLDRYGASAQGLYAVKYDDKGASGDHDMLATDHDMMVEFGPIKWTDAVMEADEPKKIDKEDGPLVWCRMTDSSGFVTLHWARTSECEHDNPLDAMIPSAFGRVMEDFRRMRFTDNPLEPPGPGDYVRWPDDVEAEVYDVACLHAPWWPDKEEFLHRDGNFPSKAARHDICNFGVHLIPVTRPDRYPEDISWCWQVCFARAMVAGIRCLSAMQLATARAVSTMQDILKVKTPLITDYITTAVFWTAQDKPSDCWTGVTAGVKMVLEWLQRHLKEGKLPCFFWRALDLTAHLSESRREGMIKTVCLMRDDLTKLLLACCDKEFDLAALLGEGMEPLTERQLRRQLAGYLVCRGVDDSISARPSAPCWDCWFKHNCQAMRLPSDPLLVYWRYHCISSSYIMQCCMLQAWTVLDRADFVVKEPSDAPDGFLKTLSASPVMAALNNSDLKLVVGPDPDEVVGWCHRQLQLPEDKRAVAKTVDGKTLRMTAELDTPLGRAELLLQPELLLMVLNKAVDRKEEEWQTRDRKRAKAWKGRYPKVVSKLKIKRRVLGFSGRENQYWVEFNEPGLAERERKGIERQYRQEIFHMLRGIKILDNYNHPGLWIRSNPHAPGTFINDNHNEARRYNGRDNWGVRQLVIREPPEKSCEEMGMQVVD
ncbi:uncharacterized protein LOC122373057 [Amphibalanus amphitrite]|uniref:uncharacterized protein LOC122373057 n=1 Tax=Amphibalanus amphitrite TaxID=1232801 RepID=UPI001C91E3D9|nr:uncharacterized protein LOC122373057 [Amphibalanus amphitrite]